VSHLLHFWTQRAFSGADRAFDGPSVTAVAAIMVCGIVCGVDGDSPQPDTRPIFR
jgi:hypothetical protein